MSTHIGFVSITISRLFYLFLYEILILFVGELFLPLGEKHIMFVYISRSLRQIFEPLGCIFLMESLKNMVESKID